MNYYIFIPAMITFACFITMIVMILYKLDNANNKLDEIKQQLNKLLP